MKISNRQNLPASLVAAIQFSDRDTEGCDYTVTELISPPRIVALKRQHDDELTEDAADRIWALMGAAGHEVLKRYGKALGYAIVEERAVVEVPINGQSFKIGGQLDFALSAEKEIVDFKFTSVWQIKEGPRRDWEQQLNLYRWLCSEYGVQIDKLTIIAVGRDWSVNKATYDPSYPPQVKSFALKVWSLEEAEKFLVSRILRHEHAKTVLPLCSDEDTWAKPSMWAAKKRGAAKATRLFDTETAAQAYAAGGGLEVECRPGERTRCERYCVISKNQLCRQFNEWKAAQ